MSTEPLRTERDESGPSRGIVTVWLEQPGRPVVVMDHALLQRLEVTFRATARDCAGLVLASASERAFVAGADLKTIAEWDDAQLVKYLEYGARVLGMLSAFPFPTAAAIGGAALGGGLELAMHADALIGAPPPARDGQPGKPYPVGLPECGLGLCPGWGGTNLLPARIDPSDAIRRTAAGQTMIFDEARSAGMFDAVADSAADLVPAAKRWIAAARREPRAPWARRDGAPSRHAGRAEWSARVLSALDAVRPLLPATGASRAVALALDAGITQGWHAALAAEQRELVRLRATPEARGAIEAFFARSSRK